MSNRPFSEVLATDGVRIAAISTLAFLSIFLIAETVSLVHGYDRSGVPATDTITVQGDGQATVPPDVARVTFTVENTAAAVSDAQDKTTTQANAALAFVKSQGVADKDVKTMYYTISPQYTYSTCAAISCPPVVDRTPKVTGYQVQETIQVTLHDLSKVGGMLAGLGKLQVQNISGPSFGLEDETAGYDAARADAIGKAKAQADLLATQLGVHLGKIVNFSESSGGYPYPVMTYDLGGATESMKVAPTPTIPTGENTYTSSVSITYEIR
jgi:uncharacterized protein YggE